MTIKEAMKKVREKTDENYEYSGTCNVIQFNPEWRPQKKAWSPTFNPLIKKDK